MKASILVILDSRVGRLYYRVLLASVQPILPTMHAVEMRSRLYSDKLVHLQK